MCDACQAEYDDPLDRRFHAQPNACPVCGPQVRLLERDGTPVESDDPVRDAVRDLLDGKILAIKGLGGYHLACRADDETAVAALRARKHREDRPFALLVADVEAARALMEVGDARRAAAALARAPDRPRPPPGGRPDRAVRRAARARPRRHAPVHAAAPAARRRRRRAARHDERQRLRRADRLRRRRRARAPRRTSPTASSSTTARSRRAPTTPSSASCASARCSCAARAATCPPRSTCRSPPRRHVLGAGAEQKNAFCVAKGDRAWCSHHIGDIKNYETLTSLQDGVAHFEALFEVEPEVVAHDLHPDYLSTRYAQEREGVELVGRPAPPRAPRRDARRARRDRAGGRRDLRRHGPRHRRDDLGRRDPRRRPRGLRARRPARRRPDARRRGRDPRAVADGVLVADADARAAARRPSSRSRSRAGTWSRGWSTTGIGSPFTSSAGRLFDAVAAMCGVRLEVSYEGQAAVEFEALADPGAAEPYPFVLQPIPPVVMNPQPAILAVLADLARGRARVDDLGALSRRARAGHRRGVRARRRARGDRPRRPLRRRLSEPPAARAHGRRARGAPACACSCPSGCRRTTARSRSGRSPSRRRAPLS